jgi:hypothetical protein
MINPFKEIKMLTGWDMLFSSSKQKNEGANIVVMCHVRERHQMKMTAWVILPTRAT